MENLNFEKDEEIDQLKRKFEEIKFIFDAKIQDFKYEAKLNNEIIEHQNNKIYQLENSLNDLREQNLQLTDLLYKEQKQSEEIINELTTQLNQKKEKINLIEETKKNNESIIVNNESHSSTQILNQTNEKLSQSLKRNEAKYIQVLKEKNFLETHIKDLNNKLNSFENEYVNLINQLKNENKLLFEKISESDNQSKQFIKQLKDLKVDVVNEIEAFYKDKINSNDDLTENINLLLKAILKRLWAFQR